MEEHKRIIKTDAEEIKEIDYFGYNSKGTFTICYTDGVIVNFNKEEFEKLKRFMDKLK